MADLTTDRVPSYTSEDEVSCNANNLINASVDTSVQDSLLYTDIFTAYIAIVLPIILFIGVIDNALFLMVVRKISSMKNVTNAYLSSLAIADILYLFFVIGHKLWKIIGSPEVRIDDSCLGPAGCVVLFVGSSATFFASLCFITLVAWERRQAVRYPHLVGKNRFHTRTKALKMITFSWLISLVMAVSLIPSFVIFKMVCISWPEGETFEEYPRKVYICSSVSKRYENYAHIIQTVPFFLAMVLNLYFYFDILRGLKESSDRVQSFDSLAKATAKKKEESRTLNQTIRMLVINGLSFFALLAPFEILSVAIIFNGLAGNTLISTNSFTYTAVVWVVRTLSYINALINPIIYVSFSSRYRQAFNDTMRDIYRCLIPCRNDHSELRGGRGRPISSTPIVNTSGGTNDWNDNTKSSADVLETQDTKL